MTVQVPVSVLVIVDATEDAFALVMVVVAIVELVVAPVLIEDELLDAVLAPEGPGRAVLAAEVVVAGAAPI